MPAGAHDVRARRPLRVTPSDLVTETPLDRYYANLDAGAFDAAAAAFSAGAVYIRLSADPGRGLETIRGREAIREAFHRRGVQALRHEPRACVVDGASVLVEGRLVRDGRAERVFLASATLDDDGLIERYLGLGAPAGTIDT